MDIVLGIIGAIVGGFIMRLLGFSGEGGMIYTIIVAVIGAVILTWIVRLVKKAWPLCRAPNCHTEKGNIMQFHRRARGIAFLSAVLLALPLTDCWSALFLGSSEASGRKACSLNARPVVTQRFSVTRTAPLADGLPMVSSSEVAFQSVKHSANGSAFRHVDTALEGVDTQLDGKLALVKSTRSTVGFYYVISTCMCDDQHRHPIHFISNIFEIPSGRPDKKVESDAYLAWKTLVQDMGLDCTYGEFIKLQMGDWNTLEMSRRKIMLYAWSRDNGVIEYTYHDGGSEGIPTQETFEVRFDYELVPPIYRPGFNVYRHAQPYRPRTL